MRIATPEGVDVELTLAGIGSRFIAAHARLHDPGGDDRRRRPAARRDRRRRRRGRRAGGRGVHDRRLPRLLRLRRAFEVRSRGRTPGKRWTGLRVVRDTAARRSPSSPARVRNVLRLVDILPVLLRRRDDRRSSSPAATSGSATSPPGRSSCASAPATEDRAGRRCSPYRPADGWDVSAVSAQDIATVRQFLERRPTLTAGPRGQLAHELADRLRPRVAGAPEGLQAEDFLERLSATKM